MKQFQRDFIQLAIEYQALQFGNFTLKSGRQSPYFFNVGKLNTGKALATLGKCYADKLIGSDLEYDLIFGPAYKGIPLAVSTTVALAHHHNTNLPYAFDRKEAKDHGDAGIFVGHSVKDKRVVIVDDVITAGTAINYTYDLLTKHEAKVCGVLVALDRQELSPDAIKSNSKLSAIAQISNDLNIPVLSIINLESLISYLKTEPKFKQIESSMQKYRELYGV